MLPDRRTNPPALCRSPPRPFSHKCIIFIAINHVRNNPQSRKTGSGASTPTTLAILPVQSFAAFHKEVVPLSTAKRLANPAPPALPTGMGHEAHERICSRLLRSNELLLLVLSVGRYVKSTRTPSALVDGVAPHGSRRLEILSACLPLFRHSASPLYQERRAAVQQVQRRSLHGQGPRSALNLAVFQWHVFGCPSHVAVECFAGFPTGL